MDQLISGIVQEKQLATAIYLVIYLALRLGKDKAINDLDTVGVSTLLVEYIEFRPENTITLDFIGKTNVRFQKNVRVEKDMYNNLVAWTMPPIARGKSR